MKPLALSALVLLVLLVSPSWARQESLTPEEKQKLEKVDKVLIDVIALSDKESTDAGPFREVVTKRLQEFGYTVVT
ncbi:MAG TPA: HEAT repeat domain-containing protein, partial [Nitrospira sp.]